MKKGGWIFISHSHQDIDLVRMIRNRLESLGFEPLMFFLKCLSDENEIEELIKREIDERDWFIYADSPNARASKWVRTEREYIEKLTGKNIFTIDLNANVNAQLERIEHISRQMKVYISASQRDKALQTRIKDKLLERDMLVICDEDIPVSNTSWLDSVSGVINDASRNGFVILLVTEGSENSAFIRQEIDFALQCGGRVVPVYVGKAKLSLDLLDKIGDVQGVHINSEPEDKELEGIVDSIIRLVSYSDDFKNTYGYRSASTIHLPPISRIDCMTFFDCENLRCVYIPDSVIYITPDAFDDFPGILVKCTRGSYAEEYCKRNGINYEIID